MKRVIVGSTSVHKVAAVKEALANLGFSDVEVISFKADSDVNEQPCGAHETALGAKVRTLKASMSYPDDICIGIEGGIIPCDKFSPPITLEIAVIAVLVPGTVPKIFYATSPGIQLRQAAVNEAKERGFDTTTVGQVMAEQTGCDHADPHSAATNGAITRQTCLAIGIQMAMLQAMAASTTE